MSRINIHGYTDLRAKVSPTFLCLSIVHGHHLTNSGLEPTEFSIDDHEYACLTVELWISHEVVTHVPSFQHSYIW